MTASGRTILIASVFLSIAFTETTVPPRPSGPVADFAGIIDADAELIINTLARKLWVEADFGLLVVTVATLDNLPVDTFMRELCREWHVWKKNDPEGVVVLVTVEPPGCHIVPGNGSREYLDTGCIAGVTQLTEGIQTNDSDVSERLVTLVNKLSATVSVAKQGAPENVPVVVVSEKQHSAPTLGRAVTSLQLLGLAGIALVLAVIIAVTITMRKSIPVRTRKREPFGNVLSGDGFGGSMLRE